MLSNLNGINTSVYNIQPARANANAGVSVSKPKNNSIAPSFMSYNTVNVAKTTLTSQEDIKKFTDVSSNLDNEGKKALDYMLKSGLLLNNKSNDKSSTLDNLHKIITNKRADGLNAAVILNDTVKTIAKPSIITQHFGNIPEQYMPAIKEYDSSAKEINNSGCCVAASIEYNLASQLPAEFARVAEGLSSEKMSATKTIDLNNLCENKEDAKWLLDNFKIPYQMKENNKADVVLAPDKNAIIRAHIQTIDKDELERSPLDVLMQSTFMNVGSQQTYNSLNDIRVASFGPGDRGLVEIEKTFTESVVTDTNKTAVTFQDVQEVTDANGNPAAKLTGYRATDKTIKRSIINSLADGQNVIIGYTAVDNDNKIIGGHEITIVGAKTTADGKLIFVCNDTDDDSPELVEYHEDYLVPKIHHVGLPTEIVEADSRLKSIA
ncbi:hypothetical protein IKE67_06400 [bacterium]|nr:hypothetical protein [bacterium]